MPRPKIKLTFPLDFSKPDRPGKKRRSKPSDLKAATTQYQPKPQMLTSGPRLSIPSVLLAAPLTPQIQEQAPLPAPQTQEQPPLSVAQIQMQEMIQEQPQPPPSPKSRSCWKMCRCCRCFRCFRRKRVSHRSQAPEPYPSATYPSVIVIGPPLASEPPYPSFSSMTSTFASEPLDPSVATSVASQPPYPPVATTRPPPASEPSHSSVAPITSPTSETRAKGKTTDFSREKIIAVTQPEGSTIRFAEINDSRPSAKSTKPSAQKWRKSHTVETHLVHPTQLASFIARDHAKASRRHPAKLSTPESRKTPTVTKATTFQQSPKKRPNIKEVGASPDQRDTGAPSSPKTLSPKSVVVTEPEKPVEESARREMEETLGQGTTLNGNQKLPTASDTGVSQPPVDGEVLQTPENGQKPEKVQTPEKVQHKAFVHVPSFPTISPKPKSHLAKMIRPTTPSPQKQVQKENRNVAPLPGPKWVQTFLFSGKK